MKIAIIGAGIAGLCAARMLKEAGHHIVIYEASDRIGGHVYTLKAPVEQGSFLVEMGVFMFDPQGIHPTLGRYAQKLGVKRQLFDLTITSEHNRSGVAWTNQSKIKGFFRQPRLMLDLADLFRKMSRHCKDPLIAQMSLKEFLLQGYCSAAVYEEWLLPQLHFWWGVPIGQGGECSVAAVLDSMSQVSKMPQYFFPEGWQHFIDQLAEPLKQDIRIKTAVKRVLPNRKVWSCQGEELFDAIVIATPPKIASQIIEDSRARQILDMYETTTTTVFLHRDRTWMPQNQPWSIVNTIEQANGSKATFWCGGLYKEKPQLFVSWADHLTEEPADCMVSARWLRTIPTKGYLRACRLIDNLQGIDGIFYAGAHVHALEQDKHPSLWHENALRSGELVADRIEEFAELSLGGCR